MFYSVLSMMLDIDFLESELINYWRTKIYSLDSPVKAKLFIEQ